MENTTQPDLLFEAFVSIARSYNEKIAANNFQPLSERENEKFIEDNSTPSPELLEYMGIKTEGNGR